ncbi:MAG: chemotaxis protein CheW [SAR324 cluster bacterium]|uniref:Chemotaxis protein CheW n=1 Tax=SAR324 cluster bacterium TaxID=2024889 RepID=A0A2A4T6D6_9DELT|nr:MAG: chemotaxis protein CheW [SAR324 cluster bacterium]
MSVDYLSEQYESIQLICFILEDLHFAADIRNVQEIVSMMEIRKIPRSPELVEGVINLRGQIIPVVNMRKQFQMGQRENPKNSKIMIFSKGEKSIGFIVDDVSQVLRKTQSEILPAPPIMMIGIEQNCIFGMLTEGEKNTMLIDLTKAFSQRESKILEAMLAQT